MRKFMSIIIGMLLSLSATAQNDTIGNFIIGNNSIIWQKVYNFEVQDIDKVNNYFYKNTMFSCIDKQGITYATLKDYTDVSFGQRPVYFNAPSRIKFFIQIKENRYRVIVQSLEPTDTFVRTYINQSIEQRKYLSNFFEGMPYFKNSGEIKQSFYKTAPLLDETLCKLFKYNYGNTIILDDDF